MKGESMVLGYKTRVVSLVLVFFTAISFSDVQPMQSLVAGLNSLSFRVSPPKWNPAAFKKDLDAQNYSEVIYNLDYFLSRNSFAIDWIEAESVHGHVPLLYLMAKNYSLLATHGSLPSAMLEKSLGYVMISLIRVRQDITCCRALTGEAPGVADFYTVLKRKFWYWYGDIIKNKFLDESLSLVEKERLHTVLFSNVIKLVTQWFTGRDLLHIHPTWVRSCCGRGATWGIDWGTKSLETVLKEAKGFDLIPVFTKVRATVLEEELKKLQESKTVLEFFADIELVEHKEPFVAKDKASDRPGDEEDGEFAVSFELEPVGVPRSAGVSGSVSVKSGTLPSAPTSVSTTPMSPGEPGAPGSSGAPVSVLVLGAPAV